MTTVLERSESHAHSCFTSAYWLARCEGFLVYSLDGERLGFVEEVVGSRAHEPVSVRVRLSSQHRLLEVPIEDVLEIEPERERLVVSAASAVD